MIRTLIDASRRDLARSTAVDSLTRVCLNVGSEFEVLSNSTACFGFDVCLGRISDLSRVNLIFELMLLLLVVFFVSRGLDRIGEFKI